MYNTLLALTMLVSTVAKQPEMVAPEAVLATHSFSMQNRYGNEFVNTVFKDNILLTINYMAGTVKTKAEIDWVKVSSPIQYEFMLNPGEAFAFHEHTTPEYAKNMVKTTGVNFNWAEGFKSDGVLVGDGVCQLASLMYWVAKDAGLTTFAPSNHNFANIPDVPREYGVAIEAPSPWGNLYIVNSLDKPVSFVFEYDGTNLSVSVSKISI
jgi:hypothetical protein